MAFFTSKPQPARLHKKVTHAEKAKAFYNAMKFNIYTLLLFISLKMNKPEPVRLVKKDTKKITLPKIKGIIIVIAAILLMILFVGVCFAIVPGPESNLYYYHLN